MKEVCRNGNDKISSGLEVLENNTVDILIMSRIKKTKSMGNDTNINQGK